MTTDLLREEPYISISGFVHRRQVEEVHSEFVRKRRKLGICVFTGKYQLSGIGDANVPGYFLSGDRIRDVLISDPDLVPLVQYVGKDSEDLADQLSAIVRLSGPALRGIRLDVPWPKIEELAAFRERHPAPWLTLWIRAAALDAMPIMHEFMLKLAPYAPFLSGVFLEQKRGGRVKRFLTAIHETYPTLSLGFVPNLPQSDLRFLPPLLDQFPDISIDPGEEVMRARRRWLSLESARWYLRELDKYT